MISNDIQLTEFFNLREFECPCCHRVRLCPTLLRELQKLRERWQKALHINSAFRCEPHNLFVGGVSKSLHLKGCAVDIRVAPAEQHAFLKLAQLFRFTEIIPYPARGFVHLGSA